MSSANIDEEKTVVAEIAAAPSEGGEVVASSSKDAKSIDQMEIQPPVAFVGLGKEDLLMLANRPFWVRLRWALFISFWLLWLGLLVGAALIIALSPGCEFSDDGTPKR